jgi:hypothetical protein
MTRKIEPAFGDISHLEAPIALTLDQIEEAAGGAAITGVALPKIAPPVTIGLINPDIFEFEKQLGGMVAM